VTQENLPVVRIDAGQLGQVFQNLIDNAIKFCKDRPPRIHVSGSEGADEWTFTIIDNGIGIDMAYSDRIFEIFKRLHTSAEYPGTGVGLAICRKIVDRCGGRIWFDSQVGNGTSFHFTVPKPKTAVAAGSHPASQSRFLSTSETGSRRELPGVGSGSAL
jgi:light-regulated signal transduction histidine kinase (bacteriophytochrome)